MARMRIWLSIVLACALALSSVTMAVARGMPQAEYVATLCTDIGIVTIHLDADGNPTGPGHACPDCVMAFGALLPELPETGYAAGFTALFVAMPAATVPRPQAVWPFQPRAPPLTG